MYKRQDKKASKTSEAAPAAAEVKAEPEKIDFSKVKIEPLFEEAVDFDTFSKSDFRAVKVKECVAVPKSKKLLQFTLDDGTGTDRTILSGIHSFYEPEELVGKTLIAITNLPPRAMMGIDSCGMLLSAIHEEEGEEKLHLLMVDDHKMCIRDRKVDNQPYQDELAFVKKVQSCADIARRDREMAEADTSGRSEEKREKQTKFPAFHAVQTEDIFEENGKGEQQPEQKSEKKTSLLRKLDEKKKECAERDAKQQVVKKKRNHEMSL